MGFFEGLVAIVVIVVVSLILSFIIGVMTSNKEDNSGGITMVISFIASNAFLIWTVFFL